MAGHLAERYNRQMLLPEIGQRGQETLAQATVALVGCGGLGTVAANLLARAGLGRLRLIDDDVVEVSNLHRQVLFYEQDIGRPKAIVAAERLSAINNGLILEPMVARLSCDNVATFFANSTLVLDGTDNDETRYLINEVAVAWRLPWIFAAVEASYGLTMNIIPGVTSCFSCIFGPVGRHITHSGEKAALSTITHLVAAIQVGQAIKILLGGGDYSQDLIYVDAVTPLLEHIKVKGPQEGCPICGLSA